MQSKSVLWLFLFAFVAFSCQQSKAFDRYTSISDRWDKQQMISYDFIAPDTINPYNLFVNLRTTTAYKFSNLFLIVELDYPNGKVTKDTLEYLMAKPNGELLGSGFTSVKEHKLWFKGYRRFLLCLVKKGTIKYRFNKQCAIGESQRSCST